MTFLKSYSDLKQLLTFEERFDYLKIGGSVGRYTFGNERHLNQTFYHSYEWKSARRDVIARDMGRDLGIEGYEITESSQLRVHHMNPISPRYLEEYEAHLDDLFNPEYLITVTLLTHNAIHYGELPSNRLPLERKPGDTNLW